MEDTLHCEPVKLNLVGLDGNAFSLMGAFSRAAKKQGRSKAEIDAVLGDSMSGDYNHLLYVLGTHTR
jgi:hypothetical protein